MYFLLFPDIHTTDTVCRWFNVQQKKCYRRFNSGKRRNWGHTLVLGFLVDDACVNVNYKRKSLNKSTGNIVCLLSRNYPSQKESSESCHTKIDVDYRKHHNKIDKIHIVSVLSHTTIIYLTLCILMGRVVTIL